MAGQQTLQEDHRGHARRLRVFAWLFAVVPARGGTGGSVRAPQREDTTPNESHAYNIPSHISFSVKALESEYLGIHSLLHYTKMIPHNRYEVARTVRRVAVTHNRIDLERPGPAILDIVPFDAPPV